MTVRRHPEQEAENVIRGIGKGLVMKMTIKVRCYPEQMRRSCTRGEENGKKIKAISCELSAAS